MVKFLIEKVLEFKGEENFTYGNNETCSDSFHKAVKFFNDYGVSVTEDADRDTYIPDNKATIVVSHLFDERTVLEGISVMMTSKKGVIKLYNLMNNYDGRFMLRAWSSAIDDNAESVKLINNNNEPNPTLNYGLLVYIKELCYQNDIHVPSNNVKDIISTFKSLGGYDGFRSIFDDYIKSCVSILNGESSELYFPISDCLTCKNCKWDDDRKRHCGKYFFSLPGDITAIAIPARYPDAIVSGGYLMSTYTPFGIQECDEYRVRCKNTTLSSNSTDSDGNDSEDIHKYEYSNEYKNSFEIDVK